MDDDKDEPFRNSLNLNSKNNLIWKKIGIIFIVLSIILIVIIIIISIIGFKSNEESDNKESDNEESDNSNKNEENIWNWSPAGDKIKTKWGKKLDPKTVWQEYPRPQLERNDWLNLNGIWSYSIRDSEGLKPEKHDGKILIPFSIESSLSGVMGSFTEKQFLWYEREFEIPDKWKNKTILLHFGAVDWKCTLYVNEAKQPKA